MFQIFNSNAKICENLTFFSKKPTVTKSFEDGGT